MAERKHYVGDAAIGRGIKSLAGKIENVENTISDLAVSIVEHAAGAGNGDMSRALELCKVVARYKTMNVAFLIGWFRYFGNANINLRANDGAGKVSLIDRKSNAYRGGFDVDGARVNNWNEAFNEKGERADWYAGPAPAEFQPLTIGDLAARMQNFSKNTTKLISPENTKDVNGKPVPVVKLAEGDRIQVEHALAFIDRIAATLARHEEVEQAAKKFAEAQAALEQDNDVVQAIEKVVVEQPKEQAVA